MSFEIGPLPPIGPLGATAAHRAGPRPGSRWTSRAARRRPSPCATALSCRCRRSPPTEVLDAIGAAAERAAELRSENRELHFRKDEATGRVIVQVRDLAGNVIRTIPPSSALEIMSGAQHLAMARASHSPASPPASTPARSSSSSWRSSARALTRIQNRQYAVSGMQTALKDIASKLSTLKSAATALTSDATWKQTPEGRVLRQHARRRHADGRRRHRRPHGPGQPPRLLGAARLLVPGRHRRHDHDHATPTTRRTRCRSRSARRRRSSSSPTRSTRSPPAPSSPRSSRTPPTRTAWSSPRARPARSPTSTSAGGVTSEDGDLRDARSDQARRRVRRSTASRKTAKTNVLENVDPGPAHHAQGRRPPRRRRSASASPRSTATRSRPRSRRSWTPTTPSSTRTRAEMTEKPISNPASEFQAGYGQLYGDTGLQSMLNTLRRQMTNVVTDAGINDLGDLGISIPKSTGGVVSDDAKAGKLTIDDAKLSLALESNWTARQELLHRLLQAGHRLRRHPDRQRRRDRRPAQERGPQHRLAQGPADQGQRAHRRQGKASEGAVRGHGDRACRTARPSRPG